jgi:hypothetical protein
MIRKVAMLPAVTVVALLQVTSPASAGNCLSRTEGFELVSDTVHWTFVIPAGSECLQGLRGKSMLIDKVNVVEAPSAGSLVISGPGFIYKAPAKESSDHFRLQILGENHRMRGTSEVVIDVNIRR